MDHENVILLHENILKNIEEKLDILMKKDNEREDRFDKHILESLVYRGRVESHDKTLTEMGALKYWLLGTIVTILGAVMIGLITWGGLTKQIEVNTLRITTLESIHPRTNP
jgi:hypothetical protein